MEIIADSILILVLASILWLSFDFHLKKVKFLVFNILIYISSYFLIPLSVLVLDVIIPYAYILYIWILIFYFSLSIVKPKRVKLISVSLGILVGSFILLNVPNMRHQFNPATSNWRYNIDIDPIQEYSINAHTNLDSLLQLVKSEITCRRKISKWKHQVKYESDRDTILQLEHLETFSKKDSKVEMFGYVKFKLPNDSSHFKDLFEGSKGVLCLFSEKNQPKRIMTYLEYSTDKEHLIPSDFNDLKFQVLRALLADFEFYNDFLFLKWKNEFFWENILEKDRFGIKKISELKTRCS